MSFEGFPDEGLVFYEGLEADTTKTYWTRGKSSYEAHVRAPLLAMLEELAPEFGTAKVFRPYRDVRFSNDKTPYKTHQGAVIHPEGRAAAWYVQISADGLRVAGGCWRLESDQVARYRRAVADEVQGPRLQAEVDRLSRAGWRSTVIGWSGCPRASTRTPPGWTCSNTRPCTPRAPGSRPTGCTPGRRWSRCETRGGISSRSTSGSTTTSVRRRRKRAGGADPAVPRV